MTVAQDPARSILVAEDSRTQAQRLQLLLEDAGYVVELAENGRLGLERVRTSPPALIISDVVMPELDGYQFCQAVKSSASTHAIPFVLLTSRRAPIDIIRGLELGADNFITKPFEDEYLLERVRRIFEHLEHRRKGRLEMDVRIRVGGREVVINADKQQIIELLFATSEELTNANAELDQSRRTVEEYARTLEEKVRERTRQLAEAEARYRTLVEQIPAVAYTAVPETGHLSYISPRVTQLLGIDPSQIIRDPEILARIIHDQDREAVLEAKRSSWKNGEPFGMEYRLVLPDGRLTWVRDDSCIVSGQNGRPAFAHGVLIDVTESKRAEELLVLQAEDLERSNAELQQFAYVASHDLQEPLRTVANFTQLLTQRYKGALDPEADEFVEYIVGGVSRMRSLIEGLLLYSRLGKERPEFVPTDCGALLGAILTGLRAAIDESGAVVTCDPLPRVWADPTQLQQVFQNLIGNAIKFRRDEEAPRIEVGVVESGGPATAGRAAERLERHAAPVRFAEGGGLMDEIHPMRVFFVRDNGIGIDSQYADRIFRVFQRLHPQGRYPGTGIGLAICKKIIERHGGQIWMSSQPGEGSTFYFSLPACD